MCRKRKARYRIEEGGVIEREEVIGVVREHRFPMTFTDRRGKTIRLIPKEDSRGEEKVSIVAEKQ